MPLFRKSQPKPLPPVADVEAEKAVDEVGLKQFSGIMLFQFNPDGATKRSAAITEYAREWLGISKVQRPDGRPVLAGLGLYPEMGADIIPAAVTRNHGRLVGMSLHEGELVNAKIILKGLGADPKDVLGKFRGFSKVERDVVGGILTGLGEKERKEAIRRVKLGSRGIGSDIGSRDHNKWGRLIEFDHFTFLPSASGDEKVLDSYLRGRKLDYVVLKCSQAYRWKGDEGRAQAWVDRLDEKYLAPGAVAIVSAEDTATVKNLRGKGYIEVENPYGVEYPPDANTKISVGKEGATSEIAGVEVRGDYTEQAFNPRGDFTLLMKPKGV